MPTESFIAVFLFSFSLSIGAALAPGPVAAAIISQTPRLGWLTGPLVSAGHALIEALMALLIVLGLSSLLGVSAVQVSIALLGGSLLLWMGGDMLITALKGQMRLPKGEAGDTSIDYPRMLSLGVVSSITNPFWYAWWMTVASVYLLQAKAVGFIAIAAFYLGHISADFLWNTALSTVMGRGRGWMTDKTYTWLISVCSLFLIYLAVRFLMAGLSGMAG